MLTNDVFWGASFKDIIHITILYRYKIHTFQYQIIPEEYPERHSCVCCFINKDNELANN